MVAYRVWCVFRERNQFTEFDGLMFALRMVGLVLVVIAGTGLVLRYPKR